MNHSQIDAYSAQSTYAQGRSALRNYLKLAQSSVFAPSEADELEQCKSGWFNTSSADELQSEQPKLEEVSQDQHMHARQIRNINTSNLKAVILLNEPQKDSNIEQKQQQEKEQHYKLNFQSEQAPLPRCLTNIQSSRYREEDPITEQSIIHALDSECRSVSPQNLDVSIVTRLVGIATERESISRDQENEAIHQSQTATQSLLSDHHKTNHTQVRVIDLTADEGEAKMQKKEMMDFSKDDVEEVRESAFPSKLLSVFSKPIPSALLTSISTSLQCNSDTYSLSYLRKPEKKCSLISYKKKWQLKLKGLQKELTESIKICGRRNIENGLMLYEYLWQFAGAACWKSLQDHDSLMELYLCEAKAKALPALKYLPNDLTSSNLSYLVYKIESSPFLNHTVGEQEIQRTIFNNRLTAEVSKCFQEILLLKALEYNRSHHEVAKPSHSRKKNRTVFINLEGEQEFRPAPKQEQAKQETNVFSFLYR